MNRAELNSARRARRTWGTAFLVVWLFGLGGLSGCGQLMTPTVEATRTPLRPTHTVAALPTVTPRATSTPRPSTPVPTNTPTTTPTPIIYVVQPGDTLLGIAVQFDLPAEAVQEANGIIDPRRLQIGQELIIPDPEEEAEQPPTPTPTPPPVEVVGVAFHETPLGTLWCLGQVKNTGGQHLSEVVVEVSLFDEEGVLLASKAGFTQLNVVPRGQAVPFAILFDNPPPHFAQYQASVVAGAPLSLQTRHYLELEAIDIEGAPQGASAYRVQGQLKNTGQDDVEAIRLVVVAFDEAGRVLAQRQADLDVLLLRSGAVTPFDIDLMLPAGTIDRYEVQAQGLRAQ